jgi:hypothetical protein
VSEESRRLVTPRDDVLDEVNQIYFDRRRDPRADEDGRGGRRRRGGHRSEIRIDEQTAKLDAWTDGYFSREIARRISTR